MALTPGARLGPYEILAPLGAGGMGEVYRARDSRLDRTVAIKILPAEVADDADLRVRFEREARTIAALDHPHICAVYDVGQHGNVHYLVMQHLEGETLAARLARTKGPLPLEQVLRVAIEIADALDKTHRTGITHRDLKPANIMLTKTGAKLLDFGLAKLRGPIAPISMSAMTRLATGTPKTAHGTILGTVQYMAPEQVEGREADARSDIWAFGAVLYEMATGQRPFDGDSPASVIGSILKDHPPPLSTRQPLAPSTLDQVVERCLAKDPDERWQHIGDVKHQLTSIASLSGNVAPGSGAAHRRPRVSTWMVASGAVMLLAAVAAILNWSGATQPRPLQPVVRLAVDLGRNASVTADTAAAILSPEGTRIVFVSTDSRGVSRLSTRRLDQSEATEMRGTEGAYAPVFSPDGQWVAFFADGKLKKTRLDAGEPIALCDAPAGRGASWGENGKIVAALDIRVGLSLVPADGGAVTLVTALGAGELSHRWPHILPGGKAVLFTVGSVPSNYEAADIAVASLESNPEKVKKVVLANAGMSPRYLPTGHLAYVTKGALYVVPFDLDGLEAQGTAIPVLEELAADISFGSVRLDLSQSGAALYRSGRTTGLRVVAWLNGNGQTESLWAEPAFYLMPQISPDGSRLATGLTDGANADIWVYDWQRGSRTRLTAPPGVNSFPLWTPDGQHVVFQSTGRLVWARADGAERPQPLTKSETPQFPTSFSPDGKRLLLYEHSPDGGTLIQTIPVENSSGQLQAGQAELFRRIPSTNPMPTFSPDGRWLAYASAESGVYQVYVRAFPDGGRQWPISTGGGGFPVWSRTANELFYRTEDQRLMVTPYTVTAGSFVVGKTRVWSEKQILNTGLSGNFALAPDGKRFAVLMSAENQEPRESQRDSTLVLNFFDEVRRRVAAGGK